MASKPGIALMLIVGASGLWLMVAATIEAGWHGLGKAALFYCTIGIPLYCVALLIWILVRRPALGSALLLTYATLLWFWASESYHSTISILRDLGGLFLGLLLGSIILASCKLNPVQPPANASHGRVIFGLASLFAFGWLGISVMAGMRAEGAPVHPERFAQLGPSQSIVPDYASRWGELRVGLALSGGGYRAALFHAGALNALERLGIRVTNLSTVSGGSIIGSFYAVGGRPVEFKDAVAAGRINLKREVMLLHNVARLPFPARVPGTDIRLLGFYDFDRGRVQANLLDRMFLHGYDLNQPSAPGQPELLIATTDVTYGLLVGLVKDGIVTLAPNARTYVYRGSAFSLSPELNLARRVAASGAFPVAFPAQHVGIRVIPNEASGTGERPMVLTDGGIGDNLGFSLLLAASQSACRAEDCSLKNADRYSLGNEWALDAFLVSDAGAIFGVEENVGGVDLLSRAFDVGNPEAARDARAAARPVFFSPKESYLDTHTQFRLYNDPPRTERDKAAAARREERQWRVNFDPRLDFPPPVLHALVELLPAASRAEATKDLASFLTAPALSPEQERQWRKQLARAGSRSECEAAAAKANGGQEKELPGLCAAAGLRGAIGAAVKRDLIVFKRTSTLADQLAREDVESLFQLGEFLVYLQWWQVCDELENATRVRQGEPTLPRACRRIGLSRTTAAQPSDVRASAAHN